MQKEVIRVPDKPVFERLRNVAAYARVSSGKDAMLHSLASQISFYSRKIRENPGWRFVGIYADEARTGTKDNRPEFLRLLADCREGKIDMVITKSVSRFARNTVTSLQTIRELKLLGVDVFFEEQNIHSISGDGELMLAILSAFAQEESRSASENLKWRIRKGFANGELMCVRTMFGYRINKTGGMEIDPGQAGIVREMYGRIIRGDSLNSIACWLNRSGVHGAFGGKWKSARVRDLVSNEKYTGNAVLQKTFMNNHIEKKKLKNQGELPRYSVTETHPAIIDQATYDAAQEALARIAENQHPKPRNKHNAFTGMIRCPACRKNFKRISSHGRFFWACPTYVQEGKDACCSPRIPEETLMQITAELIGCDHFDEGRFRSLVDHINAAFPQHLAFYMKDGTRKKRKWQHESRSKLWTPEMRAKAAEDARRRGHGQNHNDDPADKGQVYRCADHGRDQTEGGWVCTRQYGLGRAGDQL